MFAPLRNTLLISRRFYSVMASDVSLTSKKIAQTNCRISSTTCRDSSWYDCLRKGN